MKGRKPDYKNERRLKDIPLMVSVLFLTCVISLLLDITGFNRYNLIMVYMVGTVFISLYAEYKITGFVSIIAGIFLFNFFFTAPVYSLKVDDAGYIITFVMMFATFMMVSNLVVKVRNGREEARKKAYRTEVLFEASHRFQQADSASEIASWTAKQLGQLLECDVCCFFGDPDNEEMYTYLTERDNEMKFEKEELATAKWVYGNGRKAGAGTDMISGSRYGYFAVRNGKKVHAVVGINFGEKQLDDFEENLMLAMLNESALAFEKEDIRRKEQELSVELEKEHFRTNILRAVSHDLRTPLTSISGNAGMLMKNHDFMEKAELNRIFKDIYEDSGWLINMVENLLSTTRIEDGTMEINSKPELVDDIIVECVKHLERHMGERELIVNEEDDLLVVKMDAKLIIQVIVNLVDNAVKYTEAGSKITISAERYKGKEAGYEKGYAVISVCDEGKGIDDSQKEKIFDMFYTGSRLSSDGRRGMGIGLSLCRSIVEAHGGKIWVEDNHPHGSIFRFTLKEEEVDMQ